MTELDIGEFFIRGQCREVRGEFQAVIALRAKPPSNRVGLYQVERDRWFKTPAQAAAAARASARALKQAIDQGALDA
ncbi:MULTISPECIES: hypothetical protein [Pseudomonas]|uniref:Uncharacterized protein n=1 Tax=Pseudomonas sessilinigenes TaxID=658629 RepID=A0ABX8MX87_9PSED|nr:MULTISPECIES: hypothetical protein [Pseudomonas]AZC24289.1 hypothetical protein C4K39_2615 [Pseudomonas sessilinigenes]QIH08542.1 hypothetical protein ATY02_18355 [Pseudomonas sp. BIOMIG1BAC]QXH43242.1 hypothetical protein KSS89_13795 [Pseudomonas sessilinigenes]UMZ14555.1 hypothetical protein I9018_13035 [Pseudomonas sp. MPFS]